ncbi:ABC transporter ATP-binding protein [Paucibacter sp. APW11]|uniref:ABC transporter ATP-binding protein n=1 Tax=Roseateles aquae TaxID=3077235 RepID=A0ABU3PH31_9BURK|nr:ABC transporter ATP-binding protein [Paucibacter sp. APW11]MDT9001855.1 ABC transporter ATP-binding protein [Paucibacter sp. APW11]
MSHHEPTLLRVRNLRVEFGAFAAVDGVDLELGRGELLALVGESGSGKSLAMLALLGLVDAPGRVSADELSFAGQDLLALTPAERRRLTGRDIAMVFQDAQASLDPSYSIGFQIEEALRQHTGLRGAAARARALELLEQVEIPAAAERLQAYPHQLSGGMNQRVMIAIAMACAPRLLIADEPTTALDVTIQAQIIELLLKLQREQGMSLLLITHDLAVVAEMAAQVRHQLAVMYAGQIVETGTLPALFEAPRHPYTAALLAALPEMSAGQARLSALPGIVPAALDRPGGCLLAPRCAWAQARCRAERPALVQGLRCHYPLGQVPAPGSRS